MGYRTGLVQVSPTLTNGPDTLGKTELLEISESPSDSPVRPNII
jgi:hypothetical protein